ncbi:MAG: hypothetical protein L3J67_04875 [Hyphomicrobiaceae bacterium]|nr:hypothetical protein [Hyphomicrobiaceae bacterium]
MVHLIPYILSAFSLLNMMTIWLARKGILRGDWYTHRNFMVASLGIWGATLLLFGIYLWVRGLRVLVAVPEAIFGFYVVSIATCAVLLVVTLLRVVRHQYLPHKILARKTILVWLWTCLFSILFYPLTDAYMYPIAG